MTIQDKGIIKDQEYFFNQNSTLERKSNISDFFYFYVNKEQIEGFKWLETAKRIMEYGCGTGNSLDRFFEDSHRICSSYDIVGVDIAGAALEKARQNYPEFKFYKISENKIPQVQDNSLDAVFMFHVLHHSTDHAGIYKEVFLKLKKHGRFLINDLTSDNLFINTGRFLFTLIAPLVKNKFSDDLVVDGKIPEKYRINITDELLALREAGFEIEKVGYGHLFFFVFGWIERYVPFSKFAPIKGFYNMLINFETFLLKYRFFQNNAGLFYVKCVKE
jgi:ubiquinone/menaquinone biosynthesis C-methylase UbiE